MIDFMELHYTITDSPYEFPKLWGGFTSKASFVISHDADDDSYTASAKPCSSGKTKYLGKFTSLKGACAACEEHQQERTAA